MNVPFLKAIYFYVYEAYYFIQNLCDIPQFRRYILRTKDDKCV